MEASLPAGAGQVPAWASTCQVNIRDAFPHEAVVKSCPGGSRAVAAQAGGDDEFARRASPGHDSFLGVGYCLLK